MLHEISLWFVAGEDPLADLADANSINSISGVLKSFFRELEEPVFPVYMFDDFVEASRKFGFYLLNFSIKFTFKSLVCIVKLW